MKKSFTLLAIAALITSATFAQNNHPRDNNNDQRDNNYGNNNGRDVVINNDRDRRGYENNRSTYYFTPRDRDFRISAINNDYTRRIESVRNKFFMGRGKKENIIYTLQMQRNDDIRAVIAKFTDRRNMFSGRARNVDREDYDHDHHDHGRRGNW
ncbi:MAG: hypothetical protein H7211_12810 [Aquabacterium sp.]|nr:hypothetical protein [Ferruginibacter sp.]